MSAEFWDWLIGLISSVGVVGFVAFFMRNTVTNFFSKAIESRFEKKLEVFKSDIRDNEKELDQIRLFLISAQRERDAVIQAKRLEAAEALLRARHALSQLSMLVQYMQILNGEQILKDRFDPKIAEFIESLVRPLNIDEKLKVIGEIDRAMPWLYLGDRSLRSFRIYEDIILQAVAMMKIYSLPLGGKHKFVKASNLGRSIIDFVPQSKDGFDKFGEEYAYHWSEYFYDEILQSLRHEVSGVDDLTRDTKSIERLAVDSRQAQINVRASLAGAGLPDTIIKPSEDVSPSEPATEMTSS